MSVSETKFSVTAAVCIVAFTFDGIKDKADQPYLYHLLRVGMRGKTENERVLGFLHDFKEDFHKFPKDLFISNTIEGAVKELEEEFGEEIIIALHAISRNEGEDYSRFIERCALNPLAKQVKIYDLEDNMDLTRLPDVIRYTIESEKRQLKYAQSLAYLKCS